MTANSSSPALPNMQSTQFDLLAMEQAIVRSKLVACCLIVGLPLVGVIASLLAMLPLFAALMAGSFLFAATLIGHKALSTFVGKTLRLLVAARLMIVFVLAALLFCTTGSAWTAIVSAVLLWLTVDRMLGRRALYDLWKLNGKS
jgi:hypothetical protein